MSKISKRVIGCALEVHRSIGCGFLEAVYENALVVEFRQCSISFKRQVPFQICYKDEIIGKYRADFVIEDVLLLELKAARTLTPICEAQLLNYLHASGIGVGLLMNFGSRSLQIKRMVTSYDPRKEI